jgi:hypothetical protein
MKKWLVVLWLIASLIAMGELGRVHYQSYHLKKESDLFKAVVKQAMEQEVIPYIMKLEMENAQMREWIARNQPHKLINHEHSKQAPSF